MRALTALALFASATTLGLSPTAVAEPEFEADTLRFGVTYARLKVAAPSSCAASCGNDGQCLSWSYIKPGIWGPTAFCELKAAVGKPEHHPGAISGISPRHEAKFDTHPRHYLPAMAAQPATRSVPAPRPATVRQPAPQPVLRRTPATAPRPAPMAQPAMPPQPAPQRPLATAPEPSAALAPPPVPEALEFRRRPLEEVPRYSVQRQYEGQLPVGQVDDLAGGPTGTQ